MISEIKTLLTSIINTNIPSVKKVLTTVEEEEDHLKTHDYKNNPYISILVKEGNFDNRRSKYQKRMNTTDKNNPRYEERFQRGVREIPFEIKIYASEATVADQITSTLLAYIPKKWEYKEDSNNAIRIVSESHEDNTANKIGFYQATIVIDVEGVAVGEWQGVPTANRVDTDEGAIA